jgi:hypothetical protein
MRSWPNQTTHFNLRTYWIDLDRGARVTPVFCSHIIFLRVILQEGINDGGKSLAVKIKEVSDVLTANELLCVRGGERPEI